MRASWVYRAGLCLALVGCGGGESSGGNAPSGGTGAASAGGGSTTGGASGSSVVAGGAGGSGMGGSSTGGSSAGGGSSGGPPTSLASCTVFPADNPWNTDISGYPVHPMSDTFIDSMGRNGNVHPDFGTEWNGAPIGIPYVLVDSSTPMADIVFTAYGDESDPGPYPMPADAPVEGGPSSDGDRHAIAIDVDSCTLYELYRAFPRSDGSWEADSGAVFDLTTNDEHPWTWTSADAAGLPIVPGLARYDEVVLAGEVRHALRFTASQTQKAVIAPARHCASSSTDAALPPMGLRLRMKASYDCSAFSTEAQVLCDGLKRYGMILADNGSDWYISGAPDPRWNDDALGDLKSVPGDAFEAVDTGPTETF